MPAIWNSFSKVANYVASRIIIQDVLVMKRLLRSLSYIASTINFLMNFIGKWMLTLFYTLEH